MLAIMLAVFGGQACSIQADFAGTGFQCSPEELCPAGFVCDNGRCVSSLADADINAPDAAMVADADPDASDAAGCTQQEPTIAFSDDFDDNVVDARWSVVVSGTATALEANGQVEMTIPPSPNQDAEFRMLPPGENLTDKRVFVEALQVLPGDDNTRFRVINDTFLHANFSHFNGDLRLRVNDGGGLVTIDTIPYDAVQHRWWQFRHAGTTLFFEVSPDARTWSVAASTASPSWIDGVSVEFFGIAFGNGAPGGTIIFDNLNVEPACP
jgi:hypothetical protein